MTFDGRRFLAFAASGLIWSVGFSLASGAAFFLLVGATWYGLGSAAVAGAGRRTGFALLATWLVPVVLLAGQAYGIDRSIPIAAAVGLPAGTVVWGAWAGVGFMLEMWVSGRRVGHAGPHPDQDRDPASS